MLVKKQGFEPLILSSARMLDISKESFDLPMVVNEKADKTEIQIAIKKCPSKH